MNKEGTGYTIVFIFIVSFAFVFLLSMTNQITIEQVELNQELARQRAVLTAMGVEATGTEEIQNEFAKVSGDDESGLYAGNIDGRLVYAKRFAGAGLWGTINGVIAVTADLTEIVGLEIVEDNETPGLGGRINESWFKDQFRGERIREAGIEVRALEGDGDPQKDNGLVDGVTGATRTSESMESIVNTQLQQLRSSDVQRMLEELASSGGNA
jgi:Na+-transporting NADH:ubiquinone oxidoreductase subunit C